MTEETEGREADLVTPVGAEETKVLRREVWGRKPDEVGETLPTIGEEPKLEEEEEEDVDVSEARAC